MEKILDLVKAYEQVFLLDLDDRKAIKTPAQSFSNILNILLSIAMLAGVGLSKELDMINIVSIAGVIFFVILSVTVLTRVFYNGPDWKEILSLHLNLATFWIAVTVFFILFALFFGDVYDFDYTQMARLALYPLMVLIPVHIMRSKLSLTQKLLYVPLLLMCTVPIFFLVFPQT
jgi:hypothetical protein